MSDSLHPTEFREAMSLLSAAVNIVTTDGPGGRHGLTASAVCSVTDSPPTLLLCVNRKCATHDALLANGAVCINILPDERIELAKDFAGLTAVQRAQRFAGNVWEKGPAGLPVLRDALVSIEGSIGECKTVGSHSVLFIEILSLRLRTDGDGLVYFNRHFHRVERPLSTAGGT